jgi:hypothetical protein
MGQPLQRLILGTLKTWCRSTQERIGNNRHFTFQKCQFRPGDPERFMRRCPGYFRLRTLSSIHMRSSAAIMLSALPSHFSKRPNHMTIDKGRRDDDERERMTGGTMKEKDDRMKTKRRREKKTNEKRVKDDEEVGKLIR